MGIVWLIAEPSRGIELSTELQGNHPVRSFGSWSSFKKMSYVSKFEHPVLVLALHKGLNIDLDFMDQSILELFPATLRMFLVDPTLIHLSQKPGRFVLSDMVDGFTISQKISHIMRAIDLGSDSLSYRDLTLHSESCSIQLVGGSPQNLTLKEYMLLKLFLSNPGKCIDRAKMSKDVWQGAKVAPRTIDSQISKLRRRLSDSEITIESIYGGGYVLR